MIFPREKNGKVKLFDSVMRGEIAVSLAWETEVLEAPYSVLGRLRSLTPLLCATHVQVQLQTRPRKEWQGASEATSSHGFQTQAVLPSSGETPPVLGVLTHFLVHTGHCNRPALSAL